VILLLREWLNNNACCDFLRRTVFRLHSLEVLTYLIDNKSFSVSYCDGVARRIQAFLWRKLWCKEFICIAEGGVGSNA
jgi:hypothetical protein